MIPLQLGKLLAKRTSLSSFYVQKAFFWEWLNNVHNQYSTFRIEEAGPDRAAAEWLLRNGGSVKWRGLDYYITNYNDLIGGAHRRIQEIVAEDSCISHVGFPYLKNLEYVEKFVIKRNPWLMDQALLVLAESEPIRRTLIHLEIASCGNITDVGIKSLVHVPNLETLILADLPYVKNKDECIQVLKSGLERCEIVWPDVEYSAAEKKKWF